MKQAIIDIGSNSIRLTLYETEGEHFKTLFREKIMAGLAGYVENRTLRAAGILLRSLKLSEYPADLKDRPHLCLCDRIAPEYLQHRAGPQHHPLSHRLRCGDPER